MNLEDFKKARVQGREELLSKIVEVFGKFKPIAIYQFGSGASGYKDEFSDLDIWFTFADGGIEVVVKNQNNIFEKVAPALVKHQSKSWSPPGGSATLVIHKTKFGLFQVDYYISKLSNTVIKPNAKLLYGRDVLKRGEWILDKDAKESHTLRKDVSLLLCLIYIAIKGVVRRWEGSEFENTIKIVHKHLQNNYRKKIRERRIKKLSFELIYRLLTDLYPLSNESQKSAIEKIGQYTRVVEGLYRKI